MRLLCYLPPLTANNVGRTSSSVLLPWTGEDVRPTSAARFSRLGIAILVALAAAVGFGEARCQAVVIVTGDGSGNASAPPDDPGFGNIGKRAAATAIYLGNRWVLTAAHVGAGELELNGVTFQPEPGTTQRLANLDEGLSAETDIILYRMLDDPGLRSLQLGCRAPELGSSVLMAGHSRDRASDLSYWNVTVKSGDDNDVWQPTNPPPPPADRAGYATQDSREIRWGRNIVDRIDFDTESGFGDVLSFQTTFDQQGIADEAQAVAGDSGGPVFQKHGSSWELVGMMHSVELLENQPDLTRSALFTQTTYIADLVKYADQIRAIADFQDAALGDFDRDGELTALDIDLLTEEIRAGGHGCSFDLTGDALVDASDLHFWVEEVKQTLFGDADLDGRVAFADFVTMADHFQQLGGWEDGDFNGDGIVQFVDFAVLAQNFGVAPTSRVSAAPLVCEPGSPVLAVIGLVLVGLVRRARSKAACADAGGARATRLG